MSAKLRGLPRSIGATRTESWVMEISDPKLSAQDAGRGLAIGMILLPRGFRSVLERPVYDSSERNN